MQTMNLKTMTRLTVAALRQVAVMALGRGISEMTMARSPSGRIVLHLLCAWRDHHFRWHWQGVVREFARGTALDRASEV